MPSIEELKTRAETVAKSMAGSVEGWGVRRAPQGRDVGADPDAKRPIRKSEIVVTDEDGRTRKLSRADIRLMSKANTPEEREWQAQCDDLYLLRMLMKGAGKDVRDSNLYSDHMQQSSPFRKMLKQMDTGTTTDGGDWVPTNFSAEWIRFMVLELKVINLLRKVMMPTDSYRLPYVSAQMSVYYIAEQTADAGTKITASNPQTANLNLNAQKIGVRVPWSTELEEDSIVPILAMLREELARIVAQGLEDAAQNGDTSGTHQDTDVTASTAVTKMFRGFRFHGLSSANFQQALTTFNITNLRALRAKMGKFGVNPNDLFFVMGPIVYLKNFLNLADVVTVDKYGSQAVVVTGEVARLDGIPVVVSQVARENLNTSSVYDGTTTNNGCVMLVHRPSWYFGTRRPMDLKFYEDTQYDQKYLTGTGRYALNTHLTTSAVAVIGTDADAS